MPQKNGINLLTEWHREALILSSPMSIQPAVDRAVVEYIHNNLLQFFELHYFQALPQDTPIDEINWIHSLLANKRNIGCYYALKEICLLLNYYMSIKDELVTSMDGAIKDHKILRTFLFELYIYWKLDKGGIINKKKVSRNNQELEGLCNINGKEFLFECKKAYYPRVDSLDALVNVLRTLSLKCSLFGNRRGIIFHLTIQKSISRRFKKVFNDYFPTLVKISNSLSLSNSEFSKDLDGGTVSIKLYDEIDFIEAKLKNDFHVLFYVKPVIKANNLLDMEGKVILNFSLYQSEIFKKLEGILKKAKQQHKNSFAGPKIFFIDSEAYPEFRMGLFQMEKSIVSDEVERIINKEGFNDTIICITRRSVTEGQLVNDIYLYAPINLKDEAQIVGKLFETSY
jgi:hypothetical protein